MTTFLVNQINQDSNVTFSFTAPVRGWFSIGDKSVFLEEGEKAEITLPYKDAVGQLITVRQGEN